MRSLILILALTIACTMPAHAAGVPSEASGIYLGTNRVCRIVLSRYQTQWIQADVACLEFAGAYTVSLTTLYAPGGCWTDSVAINLKPWAPGEYLSLRQYRPQMNELQIVRGTEPGAVASGIGTAEPWYRIGYAPSLAPFTCGATSRKPRG